MAGDKRTRGGFDSNGQALNAETEWNYLLIETGILGLIIYLLLIGRILLRAVSGLRKVEENGIRLSLAAIAAPLPALLVVGFSGVTSPLLVWLAAGVFAYWMFGAGRAQTGDLPSAARRELG